MNKTLFPSTCCFSMLLLSLATSISLGGGNYPIALDAFQVGNAPDTGSPAGQPGWGGYGVFTYGSLAGKVSPSSTLGKNVAFMVDNSSAPDGGGVGLNQFGINQDAPTGILGMPGPILDIDASDFGTFDRAGFGTNFNADDYVLEVEYRPLTGNSQTNFNITLDTHDGFAPDTANGNVGKRACEQLQWGFQDVINYHSANQNSDGFAVISTPLTDAMGGSLQQFNDKGYLFQDGSGAFRNDHVLNGDGLPDFDAFEGLVPNGVAQLHLQAPYGQSPALPMVMEFKSIRIAKRTADPREVARLDAKSGVSTRFGSPFSQENVVMMVDGPALNNPASTITTTFANIDTIQRFDENGFTNLIVQTEDDLQQGGFGIWQSPNTQIFDGTTAELEVTARLMAPQGVGQASFINVVLKDMDGNDAVAGEGGEEWWVGVDLSSFNESSMTTITIPLNTATLQSAFEFVNSGDGLLSDFNLYHFGLDVTAGEGLVNLEIESIRIMQEAPDVDGDFDGNGDWDCADIDALTAAIASSSSDLSFDMNGDGLITLADVTEDVTGWLAVGGANNPADTGGSPFLEGDANLDGVVDVSDFNIWNSGKFTGVPEWCAGDFNADGVIDVSDFNVWNSNKFQSSGTNVVPEPSFSMFVGLALLLMGLRSRR